MIQFYLVYLVIAYISLIAGTLICYLERGETVLQYTARKFKLKYNNGIILAIILLAVPVAPLLVLKPFYNWMKQPCLPD